MVDINYIASDILETFKLYKRDFQDMRRDEINFYTTQMSRYYDIELVKQAISLLTNSDVKFRKLRVNKKKKVETEEQKYRVAFWTI